MKIAYHYDYKTLIYSGASQIHEVVGYDECILPQFSTWVDKPAFDEQTEQAKFDVKNQKWIVELKHVKVTAYQKQTQRQKEFDYKLLVTDDYTLVEPATPFDEWKNNVWVTNHSNQYIVEFNQVDNVRRGQYVKVCDPLIAEANIKRLQGNELEAKDIEAQALAARALIQSENPWPKQVSA